VRWADVHPGPLQKLTLALPAKHWGGDVLFVESLSENTEYRLKAGADVDIAELTPQPRRLLSRGALHEALALLFALPFDVSAFTTPADPASCLDVKAEVRLDRPPWTSQPKRVVAATTGGLSIAAFAAAGALAWSAAGLREEAQAQDGRTRAALNDEIARRNRWTSGLAAGGALLALATAALLVWDRKAEE